MRCWLIFLTIVLTSGTVAAQSPFQMVTADLPPFEIERSATLPGFNVELARGMFERAGLSFTLRFLPWARAQSEAMQNPQTVIIGLARTSGREAQFKWIAELEVSKIVFFTVKPAPPVKTLLEAKSLKEITVRANTPFQSILNENGVEKVSVVQGEHQNVIKLQSRRVDAWLTYELRGIFTWTAAGFDPADLVIGPPISEEKVFLAGSLNFPDEIAAKLRTALADIRADGSYDRIFGRYFGPNRIQPDPSVLGQ
jgi:polar amino acid transport system substrate-binding protein